MGDFKQSGLFYLLGVLIVGFVLAQSLFYLIRAWKQGKRLGMETATLKNTVISSTLFTIAPALAIVATVLTLANALGLVLPWIRLSVIGNISYEVPAAEAAIEAFGLAGGLSQEVTDPAVFATIAWVMTLGSIMPLILIPFLLKKINKTVGKAMTASNKKWADSMSAAAFIGLISAFIGRAVLGRGDKLIIGDGAGVLSVIALLSSILCMFFLEWLCKRFRLKWLEPFAMPLSMFFAMGMAMLFAHLLPHNLAFLEWRG